MTEEAGSLCAESGADYCPARATIAAVRAGARGVNVWTVNDTDCMRRLTEDGVTGIVTDFPDRLRNVIEGAGEPL
jgi:glycerophosphoryl diester phosphodiesterase